MKKRLNDEFDDNEEENGFIIDLFNNNNNIIKRKENKIYLFGVIDEKTAFSTIAIINEICDELDSSKKEGVEIGYTDIEIHLNSEGGIVYDALAIFDVIKKVERKFDIKIYCIGKIMSAALLILSAGTKGLRFAGKNTTFMLHQVQTQTMGSQSDAENELKESKRLQNLYIELISKNSNLSKKDLSNIIQSGKNSYFTSKQALEMGLIDYIS